ncbi:MAG: NUDIX hydrolase [Clostridia bacterium]|nr:NUDIX hydrolase [Clostridia bacterium]
MEGNTNWSWSVSAVVIRDGKVLLARHTYGGGKGKLIIPGGYLEAGETPQEAVVREYLEETGVKVAPRQIIGIRFNAHDWYVAFAADYVSGEARSDGNENSEVLWIPVDEALLREDVPDLTKKLIACALERGKGLSCIPYEGSNRNGPYSLYGIDSDKTETEEV